MTIDFDLLTIFLFAIIYLGIIIFLKIKQKKTKTYLFFFTIFFIYLVLAIKYTQFPIYFNKTMRTIIGQNVWENMNLIPLYTLKYESLKTSMLNILFTIPFGFGLPFITHFRLRQTIFTGIIFSITLEILQLTTALIAGFTFRVVDVNDVLFNSIGVVIGYLLFVLFANMIHFILDKWNIEKNSILQYIYEQPRTLKKSANTILTNQNNNN